MSITTGLSSIIDFTFSRPPFQRLLMKANGGRLAVLAYHRIDNVHGFIQQVDYVASRMTPISLDQLLRCVGQGTAMPRDAVLITFDDGHRSVLEVARPVLEKRGIPAVVFVIAGLLDTQQPFWWSEVEHLVRHGGECSIIPGKRQPHEMIRALKDVSNADRRVAMEQLRETATEPAPPMPQLRSDELADLEDAGIEVGNHTLTHPCLPRCSSEEIHSELRSSQSILTDVLGHSPRTLAYPNGDQDPRIRHSVAKLGFEAAFLFDHRLSRNPPPDPLRISRLRISSGAPFARFKSILSGLHPAIHHAIGRS